MNPADLKYPVIGLKNGYVGAHLSSQWLLKWYLSSIEAGHFDGMELIAADGTCYQVTSVALGPVAWWQRVINPLLGQVVPVRLELAPTHAPSSEDLRKRMLAVVHGDEWQTRDDADETIQALLAATSTPDLVATYVQASFRTELSTAGPET